MVAIFAKWDYMPPYGDHPILLCYKLNELQDRVQEENYDNIALLPKRGGLEMCAAKDGKQQGTHISKINTKHFEKLWSCYV